MAVLIVIPRARSSGAASISSYFFGALLKAIVKAAVSVVLPWSTCPIVPILTWGFFLSNFPRAARIVKERGGFTAGEENVRGRIEEGFKKEEESLIAEEEEEEGLTKREEEGEEEGEAEACRKRRLEEVEAEAKEIAAIDE